MDTAEMIEEIEAIKLGLDHLRRMADSNRNALGGVMDWESGYLVGKGQAYRTAVGQLELLLESIRIAHLTGIPETAK